MNTLKSTLTAHLNGYNIPRFVTHRVWEAVSLFDKAPVATAYYAIPQLKIVLEEIARSFPGLSLKQQVAIKKAYHVVKYPDNQVMLDFLNKDFTAIQSPTPDTWSRGISYLRPGLSTIEWNYHLGGSPSVVNLAFQQVIRNSTDRRPFTVKRLASKVSQCMESLKGCPIEIRRFHRWRSVIGDYNYILLNQHDDVSPEHHVGNVGVTFEQGMKPRLFASPMAHFQAFLEPLKRSLQNICKGIPEDFHGDQQAGREFVQSKLKEGLTAHCYDLSSATHLFPWKLQLKMLKLMGFPYELIRVMDYCSKGPWSLAIGNQKIPIRWISGQPLGLGPSFFVFSLCHHLLIRGIFTRCGEDPTDGYALLGDDIVIFNPKVAKAYVKIMAQLGCIINLSKSIISDSVAEFAGATITGEDIILAGKFRQLDDTNRLQYNLRWDRPERSYADIVSFLKGPSDPVQSEFISHFIASKISKILSLNGVTYPSYMVKKLNSYYEEIGSPIYFDPQPFDELMAKSAAAIEKIFTDCPECFPDATTPYLLSTNMKVLIGLQELVRAAVEDTSEASCIPIWYEDLMRILGCDNKPFSVPTLIRCSATFLLTVCFCTTSKKRTMHNRYQRVLKAAIARYNRIREDGECAVWDEIFNMSRYNGHSLDSIAEVNYQQWLARG